ncbi:YceI family protein [Streptomyces sp. NPDC088387]|uniref:YceI family protein n=1 Tax=Streptomyces sp. NPDC088387 TaxID=3365859 RepID=UPI00382CD509
MTVAVETGLWQLDASASTVALRHKTLWGLVTVKGAFTGVASKGEVRPDGSATGTLTLEVASLDTKNPKRDAHLRSADHFDADNFPEITFVARNVELGDDNAAHIVGQLTVRGVSRPLSFIARLVDSNAEALTLEGEFTVDRHQFGVSGNQLGMIRGLTTVETTLRFRRATS